MAKKTRAHYKDPNRRSNWFKGEQVPEKDILRLRKQRFSELKKQGHTDHSALCRSLEIVPKP